MDEDKIASLIKLPPEELSSILREIEQGGRSGAKKSLISRILKYIIQNNVYLSAWVLERYKHDMTSVGVEWVEEHNPNGQLQTHYTFGHLTFSRNRLGLVTVNENGASKQTQISRELEVNLMALNMYLLALSKVERNQIIKEGFDRGVEGFNDLMSLVKYGDISLQELVLFEGVSYNGVQMTVMDTLMIKNHAEVKSILDTVDLNIFTKNLIRIKNKDMRKSNFLRIIKNKQEVLYNKDKKKHLFEQVVLRGENDWLRLFDEMISESNEVSQF